MKLKNLLLATTFLFGAGLAFAQAPQNFNYQAVARNASGNVLASQPVGIQITLHQTTPTGTVVYSETHAPTTTSIGLMNLSIGAGTVTSGTFNTIDWAAGPYYVEIGMDATGGTSYVSMGTQQLLSVPYALYAENSAPGPAGATGPAGPQGPAGLDGADGIDGVDGAAGPTGPQGPAGLDGAVGATGPAGPMGPAGANGLDGAVGATGPMGPMGPAGANGLDGAVGATGPTGPMGPAGANGLDGAVGATGPAGPMGPAGANGLDGAVGATGPAGSANITGTTNYLIKFTAATTGGNSLMQDNGTSMSVGIAPANQYLLNVYRMQLTATGDGQHTLYGYRTRDSQNDGTAYSVGATNSATAGYSFWGDLYTFGVAGFNYNDYTRCGGTLGAEQSGGYWGSLGYRSSGSLNYGVYGSSAYASGGGYLPTTGMAGVGGGFFGDMVGSVSKGKVVGQFNQGELFAAYNIGDVYTSGHNIEMVSAGENKVPAYTVTSTEVTVYNKGKVQLNNGTAYIRFDANYSSLLGDAPVVTASPMGACNGVYISSVDRNGFTITEQNNGTSNVEISWIAVGDRVDAATMTEVPAVLKTNSFDNNINDVLFDDSKKEGAGQGFWWDGTTIQFGKVPAELSPKSKTEGTQENK